MGCFAMNTRLCVALLALAAATVCSGKPYDGWFCEGVVDFPILNDTNVADVDAHAEEGYSRFPRWVSQDCLTHMWKFVCMVSYSPFAEDGEGYCALSCAETALSCASTLEWLQDRGRSILDGFTEGCHTYASNNATCHAGASVEYDDLLEGYGSVCPDPLSVVRRDIDADAEHIHGTACVIPCPGPAFSSTEWDIMTNVAQWFAVASLTLSAAVIASYSEEKNRYVRYLCYGSVVANTAMLVFIVTDKFTDQTCVEGGYYHKHTPLCYVQATLSLAGFMWFSCWQACIAINIWLTVVFQAKKQLMNQVRAAFIPTSTVLTILAPVVCLAGQNVGYDWAGYSGPVCLFLYSETDVYYWTIFFTPILCLVVVCLAFMIHTMVRVSKVLRTQQSKESVWRRIWKMIQLNRRMVVFIVAFCLVTSFQGAIIVYQYGFKDKFDQSANDFVECLLRNTVADPHTGEDACGSLPEQRPALWRAIVLVTYGSSMGVCCFLVYGTQGKAATLMRTAHAKLVANRDPHQRLAATSTTVSSKSRSRKQANRNSSGPSWRSSIELRRTTEVRVSGRLSSEYTDLTASQDTAGLVNKTNSAQVSS